MVVAKSQVSVGNARAGPMRAIDTVACSIVSESERLRWIEDARVEAIIGSCRLSVKSVVSGIRCFFAFADRVLKKVGPKLPPKVDELLAWSATFRCDRTYRNYVNYLRVGCLLESVSVEVFLDPAIARAKRAIAKKRAFVPRKRLFIRHEHICSMLEACYLEEGVAERFAMLYLTAYIFLLRVPSEGLPITRGINGVTGDGQAVVFRDGDTVCLKLRSRKNRPCGSVLKRGCWCTSHTTLLCPVHTLWPYLEGFGVGQRVFQDISASNALSTLRAYLARIGVPDARLYRTHDIRRGHADDMRARGSTLAEILRAGEWRSPAFLSYLDLDELEAGAVVEAHVDESSSEDEG